MHMFYYFKSVFMYLSGFESFVPLERWFDFAKFWCDEKQQKIPPKTGGCYIVDA